MWPACLFAIKIPRLNGVSARHASKSLRKFSNVKRDVEKPNFPRPNSYTKIGYRSALEWLRLERISIARDWPSAGSEFGYRTRGNRQ